MIDAARDSKQDGSALDLNNLYGDAVAVILAGR